MAATRSGVEGYMVDLSQHQYTDNGVPNVTVPMAGMTFCLPNEASNVTLPDVGMIFGSPNEADNGASNVTVPEVGMTFSSHDEAFEFYKEYSCKVGFGITKRRSHSINGIKYDATFSCNRNRKPNSKSQEKGNANRRRAASGTSCQARILLKFRLLSGSWSIEDVVLVHNHELIPNSVRLQMKCRRELPLFVKKRPKVNKLAGVAQNKSISAVLTQAGGITKCQFSERDITNNMAKTRGLDLREGDAAALNKFFNEQQLRCPNFFHSYDIDDDCRLKNVFWADARSRSVFKYFSDVISFDTTYLTNRYRMPLVVFGGVNHHGQSILLGCAFLENELKETYVWLFKTLLECMHGKAPGAMITYQCDAIAGALAEVFPNTRHGLCFQHILKKVPEKLAGCTQKDQVMQLISDAVNDSRTHEEFERTWCNIVSNFELGNHREWFVNLYHIRHKWVPAFVKHQFWAVLSTTQQSESMNAFFDGYINSHTSLKTFVQKYNSALHTKREQERIEDFRCEDTQAKLVSKFGFEAQIAKAYTLKMFFQFQRELNMLISCFCEAVETRDGSKKFIVSEGLKDQKSHTVTYFTENSEYLCDCLMFQFRGIVCRHALCVYRQLRIDYIPKCYIMNRWRKDYIISHIRQMVPQQSVNRESQTYNTLYAQVNQIVQGFIEIATRSKTLSEVLISGLNALRQELLDGTSETEQPVWCTNGTADQAAYKQQYQYKQMENSMMQQDPFMSVRSKGQPSSRSYKPSCELPSSNKRKHDGQTKQNNQKNKSKPTAGMPVATSDEFASGIELLTHFQSSAGTPVVTPAEFASDIELLMHFQSIK